MYRLSFLFSAMLLLISCSADKVKEKINQAGDAAGQMTGEFLEGASKGVQKAFDVKVSLPAALKQQGIEFGKATVSSDTAGTDNLLQLYVIFNQNFNGKLTAKVFDDHGLEMGRATVELTGTKDEARFVDFHFDKRTNIDSKFLITVE